MHETPDVGRTDARANMLEELHRAGGSQSFLSAQFFTEGDAIEKLHHEEGALIGIHAKIVNRDDIGVREAPGEAGVASKSVQRLLVGGKLVPDHFYPDMPVERNVRGSIAHSHSPLAQW